jgi:hemerythrin-like domain-containing protein
MRTIAVTPVTKSMARTAHSSVKATMSDNDLPGNLPGFDDPLALLRACHTHILDHCELLERIAERLADGTADEATREAARKVVRYFSTSARLHHQDEEQDLFPRLIRQSLKMADLIHALRQVHAELDVLWTGLEPELKRFPNVGDAETFMEQASRFCELNREHIRRENMDFLPLADSSLSSRQLKDIGVAMAGRRGVRYPG